MRLDDAIDRLTELRNRYGNVTIAAKGFDSADDDVPFLTSPIESIEPDQEINTVTITAVSPWR